MALELVQSAFACPFMPDSPEPPGTADLGLSALFSVNRAFSICSVLCTDFLMQEKDWEYHRAVRTLSNTPFLFFALFIGFSTICAASPQAVPRYLEEIWPLATYSSVPGS